MFGVSLEDGTGVAQNIKMAVDYYKLSADQGIPEAQFAYAAFLYHRITPVNYSKVLYYLELAVRQGNADAQNMLGTFYQHMDIDKALFYFKSAAPQGNIEGCCNYALVQHVRGNCDEAARYLKFASDRNHPSAMCLLAQYTAQGLGGVPRDPTLAHSLYKKSARLGNPLAQATCSMIEGQAPLNFFIIAA